MSSTCCTWSVLEYIVSYRTRKVFVNVFTFQVVTTILFVDVQHQLIQKVMIAIIGNRPWHQTNLVLNLIEKLKCLCLYKCKIINVYVSWIERDKILISQLSPPKFRYFADQNGSKGDSMQMNFDNFQIQKWISQIDRAQKVDKKCGHLSSFLFYSLSYGRKWCMFCKFVPISARNLNLLKQFIYSHLKDLMRLFQEIVYFIGVWATVHEILRNKIAKKKKKKNADSVEIKQISSTSNANIFCTQSHSIITNTIF